MVKFINIVFICGLLLGCRKDKVELPTLLGMEYDFIIGEWEWEKSIVHWELTGAGNFFVRKSQSTQYCKIKIDKEGVLTVSKNDGSSIINIRAYGFVVAENNRIVHFLTETNETISFYWTESKNCIETNYNFFVLSDFPPCLQDKIIKYSSYEKI